jgi:hypothetical protein
MFAPEGGTPAPYVQREKRDGDFVASSCKASSGGPGVNRENPNQNR